MGTTAKERRLAEYYASGYAKGMDDAYRGVAPKYLPHVLKMSSSYMREWEKGYETGYAEYQRRKAAVLEKETVESA